MSNQNTISKSTRNYYVDIAMILPFIMLIATGIIMLIYHTGLPYKETTLGLNGYFWTDIHKVFAAISLILISIHLYLHIDWFKKLFTGKLKNKFKKRNLTLVIVFLLTAITSIIPWLILGDTEGAKLFLGIHNKLGLLLIVFFAIHLLGYFKWLTNMTKKVFIRKA